MLCRYTVSACRYHHSCFSMGITLIVRTLVYIKRGCAALQTGILDATYAFSNYLVIKGINIATSNPHERHIRKWSQSAESVFGHKFPISGNGRSRSIWKNGAGSIRIHLTSHGAHVVSSRFGGLEIGHGVCGLWSSLIALDCVLLKKRLQGTGETEPGHAQHVCDAACACPCKHHNREVGNALRHFNIRSRQGTAS